MQERAATLQHADKRITPVRLDKGFDGDDGAGHFRRA